MLCWVTLLHKIFISPFWFVLFFCMVNILFPSILLPIHSKKTEHFHCLLFQIIICKIKWQNNATHHHSCVRIVQLSCIRVCNSTKLRNWHWNHNNENNVEDASISFLWIHWKKWNKLYKTWCKKYVSVSVAGGGAYIKSDVNSTASGGGDSNIRQEQRK